MEERSVLMNSFFWLFPLLISICAAYNYEYYVKPDAGSVCPDDKACETLSFFVTQKENFFRSNTIFYFLDGTHILNQPSLIEIDDVSNVTFQGLGRLVEGVHYTVMNSTVGIECSNGTGGFSFTNSSNILLDKIGLYGCGSKNYMAFFTDFVTVALSFESVFNVMINSVSITNTNGIGFSLTNCFDIQIKESSFSYNQVSKNCSLENDGTCAGGNVLINFPETEESYDLASIKVINSNFSFGTSNDIGMSGGLTLYYQISSRLDVLYEGLVSYGNAALQGANYYIGLSTDAISYNIMIEKSVGFYGNAFFSFPADILSLVEPTGAGFTFFENSYGFHSSASLNFKNCEFSHGVSSSYGGLSLAWLVSSTVNIEAFIENCSFINNTGNVGAGLYAYGSRSLFTENINLVLERVFFEKNQKFVDDNNFYATVFLENFQILAEDIHIGNANQTGMILVRVIMTLKGNSTFIDNSGTDGGALALYQSSVILLDPPVYMSFIGNTALRRGGGIFVERLIDVGSDLLDCFYQLVSGYQSKDATFYFQSNSAGDAGDVLYGGNVDECISGLPFSQFFVYPGQTGISVISSHPRSVCFCNDERLPDCETKTEMLSISPGQSFNISLVIVGQFSGAVSGILGITDNTNNPITVLRNLEAECNNVNYIIKVSDPLQDASTLTFNLGRQADQVSKPDPKTLFVTINSCPPGFELDGISGICKCVGALENIRGVICDVTTEEMSRKGSVWMGYNNNSNCTIVREDCPYDYCISENVTFHITQPDPQCGLNRAGIMCGACTNGYSLLLGSNGCGKCSNATISLIIVFLIAGIALVALITTLNLTLSVGTMNALIFYGNIVKINEDIFFPHGPIPLLSQFISWINLDFGIEACFYDGMTSLDKAWLQFVFPVYLWAIVILIIILSKYSKKVAKVFGNNSVPILATLILLSYAKVFRAVANALTGTLIKCNSDIITVWYVDPNVEYDNPAHVTIVILAGFFLFALALPYTIVLLFNQYIIVCLASEHSVKCGLHSFRLGLRLFLDAYNAPYKANWRAWTGLLLVVRFISVLVLSLRTNADEIISTTILVAIIISLLASLGGVYRKKYLNVLEAWFLFNLLFMLAMVSDDDQTQIATGISTTFALVTFVGIILFHVWMRIRETKLGERIATKLKKLKPKKMLEEQKTFDNSTTVSINKMIRSTSVEVELHRRETLLYATAVNPTAEDPVTV